MAKTKISEYDSTAANNTDIDSINIAEGMSPSNVNNALRMQMSHLKTEFYKTGTGNTSLGDGALDSLDGSSPGGSNVAIGKDAGTALTTGGNNVAVGHSALKTEDANSGNTAIGYQSLEDLNAGADSYNTAVGYIAGTDITTGIRNTIIGAFSGDDLTDADYNVTLGFGALGSDTKGNKTVAIGVDALAAQNFTSSTDTHNTAVGYNAGVAVTTGTDNTFLGRQAGLAVNTGSSNTYIGPGSAGTCTTGSNNTVIGGFNGNSGGLDMRTLSNNIVLSDGDGNVRTYINSDGAAHFKSSNATLIGGHTHSFAHDNNDTQAVLINNQHGNFSSSILEINCDRSATNAYHFFQGRSGGNSGDREFFITGDGDMALDGSYNSGGADYAEYFEWSDGNSDSQDRTGYTVVLDGNKIKLATSDDATANIIGAVSANASVIGDSDIERWKNKYLLDDFGAYILEDYDVEDDDGNTVVQQRRKLNPDHDADQVYVSREDRKEWATIGMMGKLRIRKGQPTGDRWIKMRDVSDTVEEWLVR